MDNNEHERALYRDLYIVDKHGNRWYYEETQRRHLIDCCKVLGGIAFLYATNHWFAFDGVEALNACVLVFLGWNLYRVYSWKPRVEELDRELGYRIRDQMVADGMIPHRQPHTPRSTPHGTAPNTGVI